MNEMSQAEREKFLRGYEKESFAKILILLKPYRKLFITTLSLMICFNSLALVLPWLQKIAIDRILPTSDYLLFTTVAISMVIVFLARQLLRYIVLYVADYGGIRLIVDIRQKVFQHLQSLSLRFYQEYHTGKLISNVISDTNLLCVLNRLASAVLENAFQLVAVISLLLICNPVMALPVLISLPIHFLNFFATNSGRRKAQLMKQERLSLLSANLSEVFNGIKMVKSFSKEFSENRRFSKHMRPLLWWQMEATKYNIRMWSFHDMLAVLTYLATIGVGIYYVQAGFISIGDFVAFYSYVEMSVTPIQNIATEVTTIAEGMAGASRIARILNTIPEIKECENPVVHTNFKGHIKFRDVSFSYEPNQESVISHLNLEIQPGEKVALVGASGSGKSTISNLLLRFYDVTGGAVLIDDIDVRRYAKNSLRKGIGVVLQEPFLFSGTIRDNIAYAKPDATQEELDHATEIANLSGFINSFPEGYDTKLGENGANISGGQKQRIAIARTALKNPTILILDEATSALDSVSEHIVQSALDNLMENKTTLIIAHRLSTIRNADKIVVLDRGRIVQIGKHDELMAVPGVYRELYTTQRKLASE